MPYPNPFRSSSVPPPLYLHGDPDSQDYYLTSFPPPRSHPRASSSTSNPYSSLQDYHPHHGHSHSHSHHRRCGSILSYINENPDDDDTEGWLGTSDRGTIPTPRGVYGDRGHGGSYGYGGRRDFPGGRRRRSAYGYNRGYEQENMWDDDANEDIFPGYHTSSGRNAGFTPIFESSPTHHSRSHSGSGHRNGAGYRAANFTNEDRTGIGRARADIRHPSEEGFGVLDAGVFGGRGGGRRGQQDRTRGGGARGFAGVGASGIGELGGFGRRGRGPFD